MRLRVAVFIPLAVIASGCSAFAPWILGPDYISRPIGMVGKPPAPEYRTWSAHPWVAVASRDGWCDLTAFALTTSRRPVRMVIDGTEQELDTSWSVHERVPEGVTRVWTFQFIHPASRELLSCQEVETSCINEFTLSVRSERRWVGSCPEVAGKKKRNEPTRPVLKAYVHPMLAMYNPALGGAAVTLTWRMEGPRTEEWYCPAFEVEWIDSTRTKRESDCPPWPGDGSESRSWSFDRGFPPGPPEGWKVRGCVTRGKDRLCADAVVRVVGGG